VIVAPAGEALSALAAATLQDAHTRVTDSVVVQSPLPGGAATVVRFLLNAVPSWIQIGGVILGALVTIFALTLAIRYRRRIRDWIVSRPRPAKIALAVGAAVMLTAAAGFGAVTWNYTQHSNDFCTGCHVMNPAFDRMASGESAHSRLSCHDCHQQTIFASARQMYLWVLERPEEIGEHARVPNRVCESCHVTADTAAWQRVASTAGHRVHLESDSAALRDVQCVTCHGIEVHAFTPANATCAQSGCHATEETRIVLGRMAEQTTRHCTVCHEFTAPVPLLATTGDARETFVPAVNQCLSCHEMQAVLPDFDQRRDPHDGRCGVCHNPHEQTTPAAAARTCATAGCHSNWEIYPFHTGEHRRVAPNCILCHPPHAARVDASNCRGCHEDVRTRTDRRPPLPFDTTRALQRSQLPTDLPRVGHARGMQVVSYFTLAVFTTSGGSGAGPPPPVQQDTFSHARHARIACLVCHQTGEGHGRLTFQPPRGCQICHHQAPAQARCAQCHRTSEVVVPVPVTVTVSVPQHSPRPRSVSFRHEPHLQRACIECHTTPVTLAPPPAIATCRNCHADHHASTRGCADCHAAAQPAAAHTLESAHQQCTACHTQATIAQLTPVRAFCATCHLDKVTGHYDQRECTTCHFLSDPAALRPQLQTRR
jgi:hypothetical protein